MDTLTQIYGHSAQMSLIEKGNPLKHVFKTFRPKVHASPLSLSSSSSSVVAITPSLAATTSLALSPPVKKMNEHDPLKKSQKVYSNGKKNNSGNSATATTSSSTSSKKEKKHYRPNALKNYNKASFGRIYHNNNNQQQQTEKINPKIILVESRSSDDPGVEIKTRPTMQRQASERLLQSDLDSWEEQQLLSDTMASF